VELDVKDRERLLVCSDGLNAVVPFDAIQSALAEQPPERAVEHLLQSVMTAGAPDNVSILVLDYGDHR
jgi:protein phosphatase